MEVANLFISGPIGQNDDLWYYDESYQGNSVFKLKEQLKAYDNPQKVNVYIDSVGGDVREGLAIHNWLQSLGLPITTIAAARVYSIATTIFSAGDVRLVAPNSQFFFHNTTPAYFVWGYAKDLREIADSLDRTSEEILDRLSQDYPGVDRDIIKEFMDNETSVSAKESIEIGLSNGYYELISQVNFAKFFNMPGTNQQPTEQEVRKAQTVFSSVLNGFFGANSSASQKNEGNTNAELVGALKALNTRLETLEASAKEADTKLKESNGLVEALQNQLKQLEDQKEQAEKELKDQKVALENRVKELEDEKLPDDSLPPAAANSGGRKVALPGPDDQPPVVGVEEKVLNHSGYIAQYADRFAKFSKLVEVQE